MNTNRITLIALALLLFIGNNVSAQETHADAVLIKDEQTDKAEEVALYKASYALVIGVSNYTDGWPSLPGVSDDVKAIETELRRQNFAITTVVDPNRSKLRSEIETFIEKYGYDAGNRLLIYYAGHGDTGKTADGRSLGYIVPADAPLRSKDEAGFRRMAVSMDELETYARRIEAKHAMFVFDSCFSGSLLAARRSPVPPTITSKSIQPVRQFITAGTNEQEVPDHSIFREQFIVGLNGEADSNKDGYVTGSELADFLQTKVTNYTRGAQTPQYGKLLDGRLDKGDFIFVLPKNAPQQTATPTSTPATSTVAVDRTAGDSAFWKQIENSSDARDFKEYLKAYPEGIYASIARLKLRKLEEAASTTSAPASTSSSTTVQQPSCSCPTLSVTGPSSATQPGSTMTFMASVAGGSQSSVTYNWTISAGIIESGQGTPVITVSTAGLSNTTVTTTVTIGGTDPTCNCGTSASGSAAVSGTVAPPKSSTDFARLIDEIEGVRNFEHLSSKLDNLFTVLASNPTAKGVIMNYGTDREVAKREADLSEVMNLRKLDQSRITFIRGGSEPRIISKFYLVPAGAANPQP